MTQIIMTITQVARRLGISTRTIRIYESEGFITPTRAHGRCFLTTADIESIVMIERLRNDLGVNLPGVGVILEMRRKLMTIQARLAELEEELRRPDI